MKWFFSKIWAGLVAFVSWIVSLIIAIFRGRKIDDSNIAEEEVANTAPSLPQPLPIAKALDKTPHSWIARVNGLVLYTKGGARELGFSATPQPSAEQLHDLEIWVFPEKHPAGIEFSIVAETATKRGIHPFWPLVPSSEWYEKASKTRLPTKSLFPTDVSRIELREGEDKYTFLVSADQECFYPANNNERRCEVV